MGRWVRNRNGEQSIKLDCGGVAARGRVWRDGFVTPPGAVDTRQYWCASVNGEMLVNPEATPSPGKFGFLAVYDWGSEEAAKAAVLAKGTSR